MKVKDLIKELKNKEAQGVDELRAGILKSITSYIARPIATYLLNVRKKTLGQVQETIKWC